MALDLYAALGVPKTADQAQIKRAFRTKKPKPEHVAEAVYMVLNSDILNESYAVARDFRDRALAALAPLPNLPARSSLEDIAEYVLDRHDKQQMLLNCAAGSEVRRVYWYVNDRFLRAASATERVFFRPPNGTVKISCADDHGRNVDIQLQVQEL